MNRTHRSYLLGAQSLRKLDPKTNDTQMKYRKGKNLEEMTLKTVLEEKRDFSGRKENPEVHADGTIWAKLYNYEIA